MHVGQAMSLIDTFEKIGVQGRPALLGVSHAPHEIESERCMSTK